MVPKEKEKIVEKLNRRNFLRGMATAAAGVVVSACSTPTAQVIEKEVTREVETVVTQVVEKRSRRLRFPKGSWQKIRP